MKSKIRDLELKDSAPQKLGIVIAEKEPTHLTFYFQVDEDVDIEVGDFIEVPVEKGTVLGKISEIYIYNEYYSNPKFLADRLLLNIPVEYRFNVNQGRWRISKVNILGILSEKEFLPPCIPPEPGSKVYKATKTTLEKSLGISKRGLYLGYLWNHSAIKIKLDPEMLLSHHVIVLGTTGSGKSYFCSILTEELLDKGYPVLIVDPHNEYSSLAKPNLIKEKQLREQGLAPKPYKIHRYIISRETKHGESTLTVKLSDIDPEALAEICNMTDIQSDLIYLAYKKMISEKGENATIDDLYLAIEKIAYEYRFVQSTLLAVKRRLAVLEELQILGPGFKPEKIIKPSTATIINLSGEMNERAKRVLIAIILKKIFQARKEGKIPPLMIIVDEGHRFAPQDKETYSKKVLSTIAREGRKFKIGLCIASQRIVGLDKDIFSQCGTKIFLRLDCTTDLNFVQPLLETTAKELLQKLPLLPRGIATITSICLRFPLLMKIRTRRSSEGIGEQRHDTLL